MTCPEIMTSATAKPVTKPGAKPETFRSHLPAIVAATTGTVLAAILGSLIGAAGTIAGMVIGSLASGTCSWWAERGIRRSAALAAARAEVIRARGHQLHPGEDAAVTQARRGHPGHRRGHPGGAGGTADAPAPALGRSGRVHRRRVHRLRHRGHPAGGCRGQAAVRRGPGQAGPRHHPRRRSRRQGRPAQPVTCPVRKPVTHAIGQRDGDRRQHHTQRCQQLPGSQHRARRAPPPAAR